MRMLKFYIIFQYFKYKKPSKNGFFMGLKKLFLADKTHHKIVFNNI